MFLTVKEQSCAFLSAEAPPTSVFFKFTPLFAEITSGLFAVSTLLPSRKNVKSHSPDSKAS